MSSATFHVYCRECDTTTSHVDFQSADETARNHALDNTYETEFSHATYTYRVWHPDGAVDDKLSQYCYLPCEYCEVVYNIYNDCPSCGK